MDKNVKEVLENLTNTEWDVFLMENNGQKNGYCSRFMKTTMDDLNNMNRATRSRIISECNS